ncbi:MAG TPA: hypothetical protein VH640_11325 [Bryobacteraceae bacterium]|jgi:hypothetical protein
MITQVGVLSAFESGVALVVIVFLVLRLWPAHRLDRFRQDLFVIRDDLFDYAAGGSISFNHPAYRLLRQSMNGFIRYGHQLTVFRLTCNFMRWKLHDEQVFSWAAKWEAALKTIEDENTKQELLTFQARMLTLVMKRLVIGSPLFLLVLAGLMVESIVTTQWENLRDLAKRSAEGMVRKIVDPRFLEEEASRA